MHVSEPISSLAPGTTYHYRVCTSPGAQPGSRGCTQQDRSFATVSAGAKRYIALGDSVTQIGDSQRYPERFFSYLNGVAAADELHNIGESGQTSGGLNGGQLTTARQRIDDPDTDATVVTIDIGGNDLLGQPNCNPQSTSFDLTACQPTLAQFSTNFAATLDSLNASLDDDPGGAQLLVIAYYNAWSGRPGEEMAAGNVELGLLGTDGTLDCGGTGEELGLNDRIACIGSDHGAKLADMYPPFVGHGPIGDYFADTVHPNGTGHQVMADVLRAAFEP